MNNKSSFKFIVLHGGRVVEFHDLHCAHQFALATHGTLYDMKDVTGYGHHFAAFKPGAQPIEVD